MLRGGRGEGVGGGGGSECKMGVDDDVDEMGNLTALSHIWRPSQTNFSKPWQILG